MKYSPKPSYRPDIDGLRALAVLMVIGFHAFPGMMHGGFIGVDVFFVISGYLISSILMNDLNSGNFSFIDFYSRRIRRLFPSLIVVLTACLIFGFIDLLPDELAQLGKHVAGGAGFIDNLLFWQEIGYFDQSAELKPLLHLWSLGVEEQFYLVFPVLIWLAFYKRWGQRLFVSLLLISFILCIFLSFTTPSAAFFFPITRFWEFLLGYFVAKLSTQNQYRFINLPSPSISFLIPACGLILLITGFMILRPTDVFPGFWATLPAIGATLLIASNRNSWINKAILSNSLLVKIGLISYPLYLWHWPLLSFAHIMQGGTPSPLTRIIAVGIAFILAWLTYRWIEQPIRHNKNLKLTIGLLVISMAFIGIFGIITLLEKGFPNRIPEKYRQIQELFKRTDNATPECIAKFGGGGNSYCQISDISKEPTAILIGDSHAGHFFQGLSEYYKNKGENLLNMGAGGCPPVYDIEFGRSKINSLPLECHHYRAAFKTLFDTPSIKTVIFAFDHSTYFSDSFDLQLKNNALSEADNTKKMTAALKKTIEKMKIDGKKVVLIYDMPDITQDLKSCFSIRPIEIGRQNCTIDPVRWGEDFNNYDAMIREIKKEVDVEVFMTKDYVGQNFPIDSVGLPMYSDKTHLNTRGSRFFSNHFNF
jgi:peptidoglycan/LPS O-acetylase OafA/YrhL